MATSETSKDTSIGQIEELTQKQTNAKISITKKISVIKSLMDSHSDEALISGHISKLKTKFGEAAQYNENIRELVKEDEDEIEKRPQWLKELENIVQECIRTAEDHISDSSTQKEEENPDADSEKHTELNEKSMDEIKSSTETALLNRIVCIEKLIESNKEANAIKMMSSTLSKKYSEARRWNELNSRDVDWIENLELQVDLCIANAQSYIIRTNESSSAINPNALEEVLDEKEKKLTTTNSPVKEPKNEVKGWKSTYDQLKRIELPIFSGDKKGYADWKAAFTACIDSSRLPPEMKLLHLKQYLSGDALKAIDGVGHSEEAYRIAKTRLEHKFGGKRRQTTLLLEQIDQFKPLKTNSASELERFSDLLVSLTLNLKNSENTEVLKSGILYFQLQKKLSSLLLTQYHRWIHEKGKVESVTSLQEFISLESEFLTTATEMLEGIAKQDTRTHFVRAIQCGVCNGTHTVEKCEEFLKLSITDRWNTARKQGLCYRCLKRNHMRRTCWIKNMCGEESCVQDHHKSLHRVKNLGDLMEDGDNERMVKLHLKEKATTMDIIALRTLSTTIKCGNQKLEVNILLDDGSTQSFINEELAEELKLHSKNERDITINVLNGNMKTFSSADVQFEIYDTKRENTFTINAMTSRNVVGDLRAIDWTIHASKYPHLENLTFAKPTRGGKVDILIGLDHPHLHRAIKEIQGQTTNPIARLTPLGWTCIGKTKISNVENSKSVRFSSFFHNKEELVTIDFVEHSVSTSNSTADVSESNNSPECAHKPSAHEQEPRKDSDMQLSFGYSLELNSCEGASYKSSNNREALPTNHPTTKFSP